MSELTDRQAEHLQTLLNEQGITQAQLADELKFSPTSVNRWVKGKARMRDDSAKLIHERWPEYSIEWLQGGMGRRELVESIHQKFEQIRADDKRLEDAVIALIESARCSYEDTETGNLSFTVLNDDGSVEREAYHHEHKIATGGFEVVLDDTQWWLLQLEIRQHVEVRINCMLRDANRKASDWLQMEGR